VYRWQLAAAGHAGAVTATSRRAGARRTAASWDSQLWRRPFQQLLFTIAGLALLPAMAATLMRVLPPADEPIVQLAAFIPYGLVGYLIGLSCLLVALVRARRRLVPAVITAAVVVLTAFHLAWLGPLFVKDHRAASTPEFRLMSLNMSGSESDTQEVAQRAAQADLVILIQTSPAALIALKSFEWDQRFPFSLGEPKDGFSDTAIYSRFPLSRSTLIRATHFQQWVTTVRIPDVGRIRLIAAHPCNPFCDGDLWTAEHRMLREAVIENLNQPLIVAGDFNAVEDHGPMQTLHRLGLKSATDISGAGWLPTYPANRPIPPLLPIDHILINEDLTATSVTSFAVSDSDHRGLFVTLAGAR
jgi:endonuclease/exonuclease/phosphatase (EEP) superfamily protein YafD